MTDFLIGKKVPLHQQLAHDQRGNVATIFAISLVPLSLMIGGAVDYGNMLSVRAKTQNDLDSSLLALTLMGVPDEDDLEKRVAGTIARTNSTLDSVSVSTSTDSGGNPVYSATVKISTPMPFLKVFKLTTASQTLRSDVVAPKRIITTSFRPVHAQGAYAKDIFVWTRNAAGTITWTQDILTYRYGVSGSGTNPAIGNTTLDFTVPDHASFGVGVKVYEDLTYKGGLVNPKILYSDVDSSKFRQSGDCAKSPGMRINVEDGGDTNYLDFQYDMLCSYVLSKDKVRLAK